MSHRLARLIDAIKAEIGYQCYTRDDALLVVDRDHERARRRVLLTRAWRAHGSGVMLIAVRADGAHYLEGDPWTPTAS